MATTVERTGCDIKVTIKIQFYNESGWPDAQIRRQVDGWVLVTEVYLNGPSKKRRWKCCNVTFEIVTAFGPPRRAGYHQIRIAHARNGSHRSFVRGRAGVPPRDINGEWDDSDLATNAGHEFGHLIGLRDEYVNVPGGGSRNTNPKPGAQPQSIMGQTDGAVQFLEEHVEKSMTALGADCPPECCPPGQRPPGGAPPEEEYEPLPPVDPRKLLGWATRVSPSSQTYAVKLLASPKALPELKRAVQSENSLLRSLAYSALGRLLDEGADDNVRDLLIGGLGDESALVQLSAAAALVRSVPSLAAPVLISLLLCDAGAIGHPPVLVSEAALSALEDKFGIATGPGSVETPQGRVRAYERWGRWWTQRSHPPGGRKS
jgi:hypothetical protein